MEWIAAFRVSDLIATLALLVATLAWLDSRKRLAHSEVLFEIDRTQDGVGYRLRHRGTRRVLDVEIDPSSVLAYSMPFPLSKYEFEPGESSRFILNPDQFGNLPDSVRVKFRLKMPGRARSVNVPFPGRDGSSVAPEQPEPSWPEPQAD